MCVLAAQSTTILLSIATVFILPNRIYCRKCSRFIFWLEIEQFCYIFCNHTRGGTCLN